MNRRMVRIRLDAKVEDPFKRQNFKHAELLTYAERRRPELLQALLTVAAYGLKHPGARGPSKGSFEAWSRVMGGILSGIGIEGFLETTDDMDMQDLRHDAMRELFKKWDELYGDQEVRSRDLYSIADQMESLELHGTENGRKISFGKLLRQYRDRIIDGKMIIFGGVKDGNQLFRLKKS